MNELTVNFIYKHLCTKSAIVKRENEDKYKITPTTIILKHNYIHKFKSSENEWKK